MSVTDKVIINPQKGGDIIIKTITDNGNVEEHIKVIAGVNNTLPGRVEIDNLNVENLNIDDVTIKEIILKDENGNKLTIKTSNLLGNYTIKFPQTLGSQGQVLRLADNNGTLEWATIQQQSNMNPILWAIIFG